MARVKLYIPFKQRFHLASGVVETAKRVGVELASSSEDAAVFITFDDDGVRFSELNHPRFMSSNSFFSVTDRLGMQKLGIPTLPTTLDPFSIDGPLFLKHRRTRKGLTSSGAIAHALCYTPWESAQALMDARGSEFEDSTKTATPEFGELIAQPLLPYPTEDIDLCFSVNQDSEILFFAVSRLCYTAPGHSQIIINRELPVEVELCIREVCKKLSIRGGFHNVDFTKFGGEWCLLDWNARLPVSVLNAHTAHVGFLDDALLHMCGDSIEQKPLMHHEQRGYREPAIPASEYDRVLRAGAFPHMKATGIRAVSVVTDTAETAEAIYSTLGSLYDRREI